MKLRKILSLVLVTLLMAGVAFAVTPGFRQDPGIGAIPYQAGLQSAPPKTFRLVRYAQTEGATQPNNITADSIVIWDTLSDDGVTVTTTIVSRDSRVAGVIVANALTQETSGNTARQDVGKRNWTWLQTYGISEVTCASNTGAILAGQALATDTERGTAGVYLPNTTNAAALGNAGFFMDDASALEQNVEVFLKCE